MTEQSSFIPPDIIAQPDENRIHWKHFSKEGGSIDMVYHPNALIADTIGQVFAIPGRHLPLLTFDNIFQRPEKNNAEVLFNRWKDVPWKGDLEVNIGNVSFMNEMKRTFFGNIKGRPNVFFRILGLPYTGYKAIVGKLTRDDYYNPLTHTVYTTHPDVAVGMQEMGYAEEFDKAKHVTVKTAATLIPFVNTVNSYRASSHAMKRFETDDERRHAMKLYEPMLGAQFIRDSFRVVTPTLFGLFGGGMLMSSYIINNPSKYAELFATGNKVLLDKVVKGVVASGVISSAILPTENGYLPYMRLLGFLGGHISSRFSDRKQAFGWVFGNKNPYSVNFPISATQAKS